MATEIQKYDEIIENYISFATKFMESIARYCAGLSDMHMRMARMGLFVDKVGEKHSEKEKKKGCQLHEAARNGDHVLALQLLHSNPNLMFYRFISLTYRLFVFLRCVCNFIECKYLRCK